MSSGYLFSNQSTQDIRSGLCFQLNMFRSRLQRSIADASLAKSSVLILRAVMGCSPVDGGVAEVKFWASSPDRSMYTNS